MNRAITYQRPMAKKRNFYIGAFDVETEGLDGRLLLAQAYHESWEEALTFRNIKQFLRMLFALDSKLLSKTIWYIHNADYDLRYLFEAMGSWGKDYDMECCERSPGRFYEIRILSKILKTKSGKPVIITRFRDSMAIFPHSLKEFTRQFAPENLKQDIGLGAGIKFDRNNPIHMEYARNDVIGLVRAVMRFDDLVYDNFQVHIKGTASSTSYAAWLRTLVEGEYFDRQAPEVEAFLRKCYNGGVVQINADYGRHYAVATTLDINSSYPASMKAGVPKGRGVFTREYRKDFPGFYKAVVTIPEDAVLPIVPYRETIRLAWARGEFETYVSSMEIEHARERGAMFEIEYGFYFPQGFGKLF